MTKLLVGVYLAAIVIANLTTSAWGPEWSIYNAFILIGLTLTTRDRLQDAWGKNRFRNMAGLILVGSGLAYVASTTLAPDALPSDVVARIALASALAFLSAETLDTITYTLLDKKPWLERVTSSNIVGATVDSIVFVTVAFQGFDTQLIVAQIGVKVAGGYLWALLLRHRMGALPAEA